MQYNIYLSRKQLKNKDLFKQNLYTQNKKNISFKNNKTAFNILYILTKENNKLKFKEINCMQLKEKRKNNLTTLKYVALKKYDNILFTLYKESPCLYNNILIK